MGRGRDDDRSSRLGHERRHTAFLFYPPSRGGVS